MTALLKIINDKEKKFTEKIKELQEYLNDNKEIVINKELFILALLNIYPRNPNYGLNKEIKVQLRRGKQGKLEYFSNN